MMEIVEVKKEVTSEDEMQTFKTEEWMPSFHERLSKEVKLAKKKNAERCKDYRKRLKEDVEQYEFYRQKNMERNRRYRRQKYTQEELDHIRQLGKERTRKYREIKKAEKAAQQLAGLVPGTLNPVPIKKRQSTKEEAKQTSDKRKYWRNQKREERKKWSKQKWCRHRETALRNYYKRKTHETEEQADVARINRLEDDEVKIEIDVAEDALHHLTSEEHVQDHKMDPARFYGSRHKNICVRPIPQDSSDSELSSEEDEHLESNKAADDGKKLLSAHLDKVHALLPVTENEPQRSDLVTRRKSQSVDSGKESNSVTRRANGLRTLLPKIQHQILPLLSLASEPSSSSPSGPPTLAALATRAVQAKHSTALQKPVHQLTNTTPTVVSTSKQSAESSVSKVRKRLNHCGMPDPLEQLALRLSSAIESNVKNKPNEPFEHQTYGIYIAERLGKIKSKRTVMRVKRKIDTILDEAIMDEMSD